MSSLRIGEAVIVGEAISIPSRVKLLLQTPRPDSYEPDVVATWNKKYESAADQYVTLVMNIREQRRLMEQCYDIVHRSDQSGQALNITRCVCQEKRSVSMREKT